MDNKKQSAQQVVGYIALGSETSREGATSGRAIITPYATLRAIEAHSIVTGEPVIPTETFIGETRVVSVESAAQRQGKFSVQVPLLDTAEMYFTVRTVPALGVAVQNGRILLLDIADKGATSLSLPDFSDQTKRQVNADLIGVIQVSGVYAISVYDSAVRQNFLLGYQFGSAQPESFVERVNQSGVEQIVDFESYLQVALLRRAQHLEQRKEEDAEEPIEFLPNGTQAMTKSAFAEQERLAEAVAEKYRVPEPVPDIEVSAEIFHRVDGSGAYVKGNRYFMADTAENRARIKEAQRETEAENTEFERSSKEIEKQAAWNRAHPKRYTYDAKGLPTIEVPEAEQKSTVADEEA